MIWCNIGGLCLLFGSAAVTRADWKSMTASIIIAMTVGCLLSLLGVLYPAILAARMQPVEAMRIEE